jgi:hypothetical protein
MANNEDLANLIVQNNNNNGTGIFEQQQNINNIAVGLEQAQGHQRTIPENKTMRGEEDDLFPKKRRQPSGGSKKRKSKRRRTDKKRRTNNRRK